LKDTSSKGSIVFFSLWAIRHPKMATRSMNTEISAAAATADREDRYLVPGRIAVLLPFD
jgi:hypothetical protein